MNTDDTALRGRALYQEHLRSLVETQESLGKIIAIDIESGDYEVDSDLLVASRRLRTRHASARIWAERIGYNGVFAVGGTRTRTMMP